MRAEVVFSSGIEVSVVVVFIVTAFFIGLFVSVIKVRDFLLSGTSLYRSTYRQHLCETV